MSLDQKIELFIVSFVHALTGGLDSVVNSMPLMDKVVDALQSWMAIGNTTPNAWHEIQTHMMTLVRDRAILNRLKSVPMVAQRTPEWYALRQNMLTASNLGAAINRGKFDNRKEKLLEYANLKPKNNASFACLPLKWGTMFESMALRCYQQRNHDIAVHEFGLIPHPTLSCFGASPDAITDLGIMVEIKCPFNRPLTQTIMDQYYLQIQGQLAVCGLTHCDYIECRMSEFKDPDDYLNAFRDVRVDHGIIIEWMDSSNESESSQSFYEYSPPYATSEETMKWRSERIEACAEMNHITVVKIWYWKNNSVWIKRVTFEPDLWASLVPQIETFWEEVCQLRSLAQTSYEDAMAYMEKHYPSPPKRAKRAKATPTSETKTESYQFLDDDD